MIGIIRNDLVGQEFDAYIWYGAFAITIAQLIFFIIIYSLKKNRIKNYAKFCAKLNF